MKKIAFSLALLSLGACGGGLELGGEANPNAATVTTSLEGGQVIVTGFAGSNFDEEEIRNTIVAPECEASGLSIANLTITPASGGSDIYAICG